MTFSLVVDLILHYINPNSNFRLPSFENLPKLMQNQHNSDNSCLFQANIKLTTCGISFDDKKGLI